MRKMVEFVELGHFEMNDHFYVICKMLKITLENAAIKRLALLQNLLYTFRQYVVLRLALLVLSSEVAVLQLSGNGEVSCLT